MFWVFSWFLEKRGELGWALRIVLKDEEGLGRVSQIIIEDDRKVV